jgi:hypothetical protein
METTIKDLLQSLELGKVQAHNAVAFVPLIAPNVGKFQYDTLGDCLANGTLQITEVSAAGSVPELLVVNRGKTPVLLIDGEELAGAKQNRVLNTSILLKAFSETKVPVSCSEAGRWSYASKTFAESGNVMDYTSRSRKTRSVQCSLESSGAYHSDQGEVWESIAELQAHACCSSSTSAMSDVFKAREEELTKCEKLFKPVRNQVGLVAFIGGAAAGLDLFSLSAAYGKLHRKLLRSYALQALFDSKETSSSADAIAAEARKFLRRITTAKKQQFPSVGLGTDLRFKGRNLVGTALVHESELVHGTFFRVCNRAA